MAKDPCENDIFADSYRAFVSFKYLYNKKTYIDGGLQVVYLRKREQLY